MKSAIVTITNDLVALCSGMTVSSLLITHSESWKVSLSLVLIVISLRLVMDEKEK